MNFAQKSLQSNRWRWTLESDTYVRFQSPRDKVVFRRFNILSMCRAADVKFRISRPIYFFSAWPRPLTLNSEIRRCALFLGEPLGFGVEKWYFLKRSGRCLNLGPRASEQDALSTLLRPTWQAYLQGDMFFVLFCFGVNKYGFVFTQVIPADWLKKPMWSGKKH